MKMMANRCGTVHLSRQRTRLREVGTMLPVLISAVLLMAGFAHDYFKAGGPVWMSLLVRFAPCLPAAGAWLVSKKIGRSSRFRRNAVSGCCIALVLGLGSCVASNLTLSGLGVVLLTAIAVIVSALAVYALHHGGHVAAVVMGGVLFVLLLLATSLEKGGISAALIVIVVVCSVFLWGLFGCWFSPPPDFWSAAISILLFLGSSGALLLGVFFLDDRLAEYLTIHLLMEPLVPDGIQAACAADWIAVSLLLMLLVSLCVAFGINRHRGLSRWIDIATLSALCAFLLIGTARNLGVHLFIPVPLYGADLLTNGLTLLGVVHIARDERPEPPLALSVSGTYLLEKLDRETDGSEGKLLARKVEIYDCEQELLRLFCRDHGVFRIEREVLAGALLRKTEGMLLFYQGETAEILALLPEIHCSYGGDKVFVLVCGKEISPAGNLLLVANQLRQTLPDRELRLAICADEAVGMDLVRVLLLFL